MSIETAKSLAEKIRYDPRELNCFYCGEELDHKFVYWHGNNKIVSLVLHPHCVSELFWKLEADALEIKAL